MFGTIQLSDVIFGSHVSSMSKAKESLAGVGKPTFNTTGESKALDCTRNNSTNSTSW